ncbi:MAG: hypothetical protein IV109_06510 [Rhodoferax sp.]|nr:hypothetical protein [Rhodoferax sp.]
MLKSTKSHFFHHSTLLRVALAALTTLLITGCATHYVDTALKDVPPEKVIKVQSPKPVQFLFEFQTKGATNARATEQLKIKATELVQRSALFSQVGSAPVASGSVLNIVVNNVLLTDDAAAKGFVTGLTFGLAGSTVTDGYICTIDYLPGGAAPKISKTVRHAIHTSLGSAGAPVNAPKSASIQEAVETMLRQIISNGLNNLASDPSFN